MLNDLIAFTHRFRLEFARNFPFLIPKNRGGTYHYLLTTALMGLALFVRLAIAPVSAGLQYVTFFPAVTLSAIFGGYRSGLFATIIGLAFSTYIFTPPYYSFSTEALQTSFWSNMVFLMDGIIVTFSIEAMHRFRQKYQQELKETREHEAQVMKLNEKLNEQITERKQVEQALKYSEAVYRELFENMSNAVAIYEAVDNGEDFVFRGFNRSGELMDNIKREQLIGKRLTEIFPGVKEFGLFAVLLRVWQTGQSEHFPVALYQDSRISGWRENFVYRLPSNEVVAIYDDVTEIKRAETELRIAAVAFEAHDAILITDAQANIIRVNRAFTDITGYSPEDVLGKNPRILNSGRQDKAFYAAMWQQLLATGSWAGEIWDKRKSGRIYPKWLTITAIKDEAGKTTGYVAMFNDITARKQAEEALRESENRHRLLIENSPVCIHEIDMDGRIASMNQAGLLMLGIKDEYAVRGFLYLDAVCAADRERIGELLARAYAGETSHFEFKSSGPHGQIFKSCFVPIRNREGSVEKLMGITEDITARKQAEEEIHHLAFYDTLTKLPNRRLFIDRFGAALIASARHNNFGAVLFIDLDRFKLLNDTLGHDYGDLLLVEVAVRIKACVREMDTVARLGGDEFVVLMEGISNDQEEASLKTGLVAEKIRESLARPYDLNGHEHHSSPSIGVSLYRGNEETVEELLQHADMAMYQAKDSGRNAVRFFDPVMQSNVSTRAALVNDLRSAIAHRQLHLHYQLQVDNDNHPVGAEALLRWIHPQRGMVMPEQFLPVAEESTLILDICSWVQETACRQLVLWSANEKTRDLVLTVNISAKQFALPDFVDKVANALRKHQINPARLKLELTESMALNDLQSAAEKMRALKALGVLLSMDDFGTRYSSLSNLKQLPLDQVKLGRSFVHDVAIDGNVALLVQSIIDMSSKYRITVIAEGVENKAQLTSLKDRDCVAYQGFLFSKAVPIEEFEQLLS